MAQEKSPYAIGSAGGIVRNASGDILIVEQSHGTWSLPKGKIEDEEQPLDAAAREIQEETGLSGLSCLGLLDAYTRWKMTKKGGDDTSERKCILMYLFETDASSETPLRPKDDTIRSARWVTIDEAIKRLTHPADKTFLTRMKKRIA